MSKPEHIRTPLLNAAYQQSGPTGGVPVLLLHGFPYSPASFDDAVEIINAAGYRTIVPYLRGYGPTEFLSSDTMRSGQQAALGQDLLHLMDALRIEQAVLAGFDWGGRAACIVSAVWPERVRGLVSCGGYNIQNLTDAARPGSPEQEARLWYQYYFHTERGRNGLSQNRDGLARLMYQMWSPSWAFNDATFERSALAFANDDFVDVVLHSYRHRTGSAQGDPRYAQLEAQLAAQLKISVPTIVLHGEEDGVSPVSGSENDGRYFAGPYVRRVLPGIGHNPPQEDPRAFAAAVLELCRGTMT